LSFGGGGGSVGVSVHRHDSQVGEGGPLQLDGTIITGTSVQINGGAEITASALI